MAAADGWSRPWSEMTGDLVSAILMRLEAGELVRAAAACRWWRHCASSCTRQPLSIWLMVLDEEKGEGGEFRQMLSLGEEGMTYWMRLPQIRGMHCVGSAVGWLIAMDNASPAATGDLFAFNPITGSTLPLPGITELPWIIGGITHNYNGLPCCSLAPYGRESPTPPTPRTLANALSRQIIDRFVTSNSLAAMVAIGCFGKRLAFCRPGDSSWTELRHPQQPQDPGYDIFFTRIENAIFYKGCLYVVNLLGCISIYDLSSSSGGIPPRTLYGTSMSKDSCLHCRGWMYLVRSYHGYLLLVWRQMKIVSKFQTVKIKVYRLVEEEGNDHWVHLDSLVDEALFIGFGQPMSFSTKHHRHLTSSSIYFTDDISYNIQAHQKNQRLRRDPPIIIYYPYDPDLYIDIGVYNLHDGTVQHLYQDYCSHRKWPPPIWFTPSSIHFRSVY